MEIVLEHTPTEVINVEDTQVQELDSVREVPKQLIVEEVHQTMPMLIQSSSATFNGPLNPPYREKSTKE